MNVVRSHSSLCIATRPVLHKSLELQWQWKPGKGGFDFNLRFKTTGDHAGFRFMVELWGLFFEFTAVDNRHWNYQEHRFYEAGEEEQVLELPLYDALETLLLEGLNSPEHELASPDWDVIRQEAMGRYDAEDDESAAKTWPPSE